MRFSEADGSVEGLPSRVVTGALLRPCWATPELLIQGAELLEPLDRCDEPTHAIFSSAWYFGDRNLNSGSTDTCSAAAGLCCPFPVRAQGLVCEQNVLWTFTPQPQ